MTKEETNMMAPNGPADTKGKKKKKQSNYSYAFRQQILKAWQPVPTLGSTVCIFISFGAFFLTLGLVLWFYTKDLWDYKQRYDNKCTIGTQCTITINIDEDVEGPVFFYYELNNFYQNHRRYLNSRQPEQLKGEVKSASDLDDCKPAVYMKDIGRTLSIDNTTLSEDTVANPCGLVARSYFTDTYSMADSDGVNVEINEKNIAWKEDREDKFKRAPNYEKIQWIDVENEHFIVWMRTAAMPKFQKLWGRIERDLPAGEYTMTIDNTYDVSSFKGEKYVYFSQANTFGGTNSFLAIAYLAVGSASILFAFIFLINRKLTKSKFLEVMNNTNKNR